MGLDFGFWELGSEILSILCGWWGVDDDWDFRVSGLSAVRVFWRVRLLSVLLWEAAAGWLVGLPNVDVVTGNGFAGDEGVPRIKSGFNRSLALRYQLMQSRVPDAGQVEMEGGG